MLPTNPISDKTPEEIVQSLEGQWAYVFDDLCPSLGPAIAHAGHHVPCPVHGGTDGFRLFPDFANTGRGICNTCGAFHGVGLIAWVSGLSRKEAFKAVVQWLRQNGQQLPSAPRKQVTKPYTGMDPKKAAHKIREAWESSQPIEGSMGARYLESRGIWPQNIPPSLHIHPGLRYFDPKTKTDYGVHPCILAPQTIDTPEGRKTVTLQRIFLQENTDQTPSVRKAAVPDPKRMMSKSGPLPGSYFDMWPLTQSGRWDLAEGIETGLACHAIAQEPIAAAMTAGLMESVLVPPGVQHIVLWCDLDLKKRGQSVPQRFSDRHPEASFTVDAVFPPISIATWIAQMDPERQALWTESKLLHILADQFAQPSLALLKALFDKKGVDWLDVLTLPKLNGMDPCCLFPDNYNNFARHNALQIGNVEPQHTGRVHICATLEDAWIIQLWTQEPVWLCSQAPDSISVSDTDWHHIAQRVPNLNKLVVWDASARKAALSLKASTRVPVEVIPVPNSLEIWHHQLARSNPLRAQFAHEHFQITRELQPTQFEAIKTQLAAISQSRSPWLTAFETSLELRNRFNWPLAICSLLPLDLQGPECKHRVAQIKTQLANTAD